MSNINKIIFILFLNLVIYFFFLLNINSIFTFEYYKDFGLYSDDELYLSEQLLYLNKLGLNSDKAQYGVEFYFFNFFFKILSLFKNFDEINKVYTVISFHTLLGLFSIFFICKILLFFKVNRFLTFIIFPILVFSDKKILFNFSSLKPDGNVCLFLIILSIFFLKNFHYKINFLLSIFFAALAFSIKLWGIFLLAPIIYYINASNCKLRDIVNLKILFFLIIFLILIFSTFLIINFIYFFQFFKLNIIFALSLCSLIIFFFVNLYNLKKYLNFFIYSPKIYNGIVIISLFFFFSLILFIPIMVDSKIFLSSIKYFLYDSLLTNHEGSSYYLNFVKILEKFLYEFKDSGILIFLIISLFLYKIKKKDNRNALIVNVILILSSQIIIFYFIYGRVNSGFNILLILLWIFILFQWNYLAHAKIRYYNILSIFILFFLIIKLFFLFSDEYNYFKYPKLNYANEANNIRKKILEITNKTNNANKILLYSCGEKLELSLLKSKELEIVYLNRNDCNKDNYRKILLDPKKKYLILASYQFMPIQDYLIREKGLFDIYKITYSKFINFKLEEQYFYIINN